MEAITTPDFVSGNAAGLEDNNNADCLRRRGRNDLEPRGCFDYKPGMVCWPSAKIEGNRIVVARESS